MPTNKPLIPCNKYNAQHKWLTPLDHLKAFPYSYSCLRCGKSYAKVLEERKAFNEARKQ